MEALQGYGSSSDSEDGHSRGFDSAPPLQSTQRAQGALPQPGHDAQPPKPATSGLKLPSANDLFGSPSQTVRYAAATLRLTDQISSLLPLHDCMSYQQRVRSTTIDTLGRDGDWLLCIAGRRRPGCEQRAVRCRSGSSLGACALGSRSSRRCSSSAQAIDPSAAAAALLCLRSCVAGAGRCTVITVEHDVL